MRAATLVIALGSLLSALALGCSIEPIRLGDDSSGELGRARFEFQSSECVFGCSLDRPALAGSMVTIIASGGDGNRRASARFAPGAVSRIAQQSESCSCETASGASRSTAADMTCLGGETKACRLSIDVETSANADDRIEIVEANGEVRDAVTLHVRPAARIELTVRVGDKTSTPGSDGVYAVKRGDRVALTSKVLAADGSEVVFTKHGVSHVYGDRTVLQPDTKVLLGATDVEYMVTGRTADTSIVVSATGANATAFFRVSP